MTAHDNLNNNLDIEVTTDLDINKAGRYIVTYSATNDLGTSTQEIIVYVVSVNPPTIILNSPITSQIYVDETYTIPLATAKDYKNVSIDATSNETSIMSSVPTTITVIYHAIDGEGNEAYLYFEIKVINEPSETHDYYNDVSANGGNELLFQLRDLITKTHNKVSYDALRYYLEVSDEDPNNPGYLYLIYNNSFDFQTIWDAGKTWNREHVWPQSLLVDTGYSKSDAHHVRASEMKTNSSRGNKAFTTGSGEHGYTINNKWYPGDEHIGDVARIMFYMITRYPGLNINTMGSIDMFIEWHTVDPVSEFELQRNDFIFSFQENRNPYIDNPEYVYSIWGEVTSDGLKTKVSIHISIQPVTDIPKREEILFS